MTHSTLTTLSYSVACVMLALFFACTNPNPTQSSAMEVSSLDGAIKVKLYLNDQGQPTYQVNHQGEPVILPSTLGFDLKDAAPIREGFKVIKSDTRKVTDDWEMPWGEQLQVKNRYQELKAELQEKGGDERRMNLVFRVTMTELDLGTNFRSSPIYLRS